MIQLRVNGPALLLACSMLSACGSADLSVEEGSGGNPSLPPPDPSLLPVVDIAPAEGWREGERPSLADRDLRVELFAAGFDHPRWLYTLPNGDILVAETNAPERPEARGFFSGLVVNIVKKIIGTSVPSADRITLLRDADGDGQPEVREVFLENLHSPFGMALVGDDLYVANTDALLRFPYREGATRLQAEGEVVTRLPAGPINYHWTRNVIASPEGSRLYVTVGSNSDHGEKGLEHEEGRARILEVDPATGELRDFATGLRNPNGLAWEPVSGELWTTVNERDKLGSDLVPDYMTSVRRGEFFGWPFSYFGDHEDPRVKERRPDLLERARVPDYALGPHTSSIGLVFYTGEALPRRFQGGAFVAQHGSYNRRPPSGYKVIYVPFEEGQPAGLPVDVLTGFLDADGDARGRPVGLTVAGDGALLVADDIGNAIWRVSGTRDALSTSEQLDPSDLADR